jgi:hypothetical protein
VRRSRCKGRSALALAAVRNGRSAPAQTIGTRVVIDGVLAGGKFGARGLRAAYVVALDDGQRPFRGLCLQQQGCSPSEGARRGRSSATERSAIEQQGRTPARRRVIRSGSTGRSWPLHLGRDAVGRKLGCTVHKLGRTVHDDCCEREPVGGASCFDSSPSI